MKEHEIVLTPALTISCTVTDERTGAPIPRFRIITGWPSPDRASGTMGATWSSIDRFWLGFEGGQFQHLYEELVPEATHRSAGIDDHRLARGP